MRGPTTPANAGRLEVMVGGTWGTVCAQRFGIIEAKVACRQLGKKGGVPHSYSRYGVAPAGTPTLVSFSSILQWCDGTEASLNQCNWELNPGPCYTEGEAGLECSP